jgi:hypothetical protein
MSYNNSNNSNNQIKNYLPKNSSNYNGVIIGVLTVLYILLITKLADVLTSTYEEEEIKLERYVMIIYFLSIMGLVIGYVWLAQNTNGNYVIRRSLTFGGVIMLLYTIINYWEYLDDYSKLIMITLSISFIIYYVYQ